MIAPLRITLALLGGLFIFSGCGSDDKKTDDEKDEKKPAYERVVILKQRFTQLENSLDEMERDLEIQKKRIDSTRETAKSIKRSLLKGNLKGYSMDTVSSDPLVITAMEKRQEKAQEKEAKQEKKSESDDLIFNILLITLFLIFLVVLFVVAFKDRKQTTPYDTPATPVDPDSKAAGSASAEAEADATDSSSAYGDLGVVMPRDTDSEEPNDILPPSVDEPDDEEPRQ